MFLNTRYIYLQYIYLRYIYLQYIYNIWAGDVAPHDGQHGPLRGGGHIQLRHAAGRGARGQVSTFCIRSHVDISTSGDTWPDQHSVT